MYTPADRERLMKQVENKRIMLLSGMEELREELGEEVYATFQTIVQNEVVDPKEFATRSIIVQPTGLLSQIYQLLGWKYQPPKYNPDYDSFVMIGYPGGKEKPIGWGVISQEAEDDARNYLLLMGYIINMKPITRYYAH